MTMGRGKKRQSSYEVASYTRCNVSHTSPVGNCCKRELNSTSVSTDLSQTEEDKVSVTPETHDDAQSMNNPPLWRASHGGDIVRVKELLGKRVKIEEKDKKYGHTALSIAAFNGYWNIVEELVKHNASVETRDIMGGTPLMGAAQKGHLDMVIYLIEKCHASVAAENKIGSTATFLAFTFNHVQVAEYLLQHGGSIEVKLKNGLSTLMSAAQEGSKQSVIKLLSMGCQVNQANKIAKESALHLATFAKQKDVVKCLLSMGADVQQKNIIHDTALHITAYENIPEIAKLLVAHEADIELKNKKGKRALDVAIKKRALDVAIKKRALDVAIKKRALDVAIKKHHVDIVHLLRLEELRIACVKNDISKVEKLASDTYINGHFVDGTSVLITACRGEHVDICRMLLKRGANIRKKSESGESALGAAVKTGNKTLVSELLKYDPGLMRSEIGKDALNLASQLKMDAIVILLKESEPGHEELMVSIENLLAGLGVAIQDTKQKTEPMKKLETSIFELRESLQELKKPNAVPIEKQEGLLKQLEQCMQQLDQTTEVDNVSHLQELLTDIKHGVQDLKENTQVMAKLNLMDSESKEGMQRIQLAVAENSAKISLTPVMRRIDRLSSDMKEATADIKQTFILDVGNTAKLNVTCKHPVLVEHQGHLVDNASIDRGVLDCLFETGIISREEVDQIEKKPLDGGRVKVILILLDEHGDEGVAALLEALEKSHKDVNVHLFHQLKQSFQKYQHSYPRLDLIDSEVNPALCKDPALWKLQGHLVDKAYIGRDVLECLNSKGLISRERVDQIENMPLDRRVKPVLVCVDEHSDSGAAALLEALEKSHKDSNNRLACLFKKSLDRYQEDDH